MYSAKDTFDWSQLSSLKLKAKFVSEGIYAGAHRSRQRGAGVEFEGYRSYTPGDDLRWLDRHALMRHGRLLIREFETETDQVLWLILDATRSMAFDSSAPAYRKVATALEGGTSKASKFEYSCILSGALARLTVRSGDWVALDWIGGSQTNPLGPAGGGEAFERIVNTLELAKPTSDLSNNAAELSLTMARVAQHARRGSIIIVFSDLLDLPSHAEAELLALTGHKRTVVLVRILDPLELTFPFSGPLELVASEGQLHVETDGNTVRQRYLDELQASSKRWKEALQARGAGFLSVSTAQEPIHVLRRVLRIAGGAP